MKIGILGWGSLIKNPGQLVIEKQIGNHYWLANGPLLPIEFSRISNDKRLTLVIDDDAKEIETLWARSSFEDLSAAIENLRLREGMPSNKSIGFVNLIDGTRSEQSKQSHVDEIRGWAQQNNLDAVIWTGLKPNFQTKVLELYMEKREFNIVNIKWYLESLESHEYIAARDYILDAPVSTNTSLRIEIERLLKVIVVEQVLLHEAGHVLLAKAFNWEVDKVLKNYKGCPLVIMFCKQVNGQKICGVINNSKDPIAEKTNWERTIITQGGWAAENFRNYRIQEQFNGDLKSAGELLSELPSSKYNLEKARQIASEIIGDNKEILFAIKDDLKELVNGSHIDLNRPHNIKLS